MSPIPTKRLAVSFTIEDPHGVSLSVRQEVCLDYQPDHDAYLATGLDGRGVRLTLAGDAAETMHSVVTRVFFETMRRAGYTKAR